MIGFLRQNLFWMVLSVVLSIGLWMVVTIEENPRESNWFTSVPVEILNVPPNLIPRSNPDPVRILISAPQDVWRAGSLGQDKIRATVDASAASPGLAQLSVIVAVRDTRARVETIDPRRVDLRLEPIQQKEVPVRLLTSGSPPFGFELKSSETTPKVVSVSGPQSLVEQLTFVQAIVSLEGSRTSISQPFPVLPMSDSGAIVGGRLTLLPDRVLADITIVPAPTFKTVPVQPQLSGQVAIGYEIVGLLPEPATITVTGAAETLRDLTVVKTKQVDASGASADLAVNVDLDLPSGVGLARTQPILVRVLVSPIEGSKTIEIAPLIRHRDDQSVSVSPGSVQVRLVGPMPILTEIRPQSIQVIVDVTALGPGNYDIRPTVITPPLVQAETLEPTTLKVSVR